MGEEASVFGRAHAWIVGNDTGESSKTLWAVMMGQKPDRSSYPHDAYDLGRCLRLLRAIPEWKERLWEMSAVSDYWAALVPAWPQLEALFIEECGPELKSDMAKTPKTYAAMQEILGPVEDADPRVIRMGRGVTMNFGR
jgi:hypothetical protein